MQIIVRDEDLKKGFSALKNKIGNLKPVMLDIGEIVRRSVMKNFDAGGRPKWEPSIRVKQKGGVTLTDKARLKNSFTVRADSKSATVGTNVKYAATHQFGRVIPARVITAKKGKALPIMTKGGLIFRKKANIPEVTIPARPFLLVQNEDWRSIREAINEYLVKQ